MRERTNEQHSEMPEGPIEGRSQKIQWCRGWLIDLLIKFLI